VTQNSLWKYNIASNSWTWISGYNSSGQGINNSFPYYRTAVGSAGDSSRYGYIFGGQVNGSFCIGEFLASFNFSFFISQRFMEA
jgi:hypothetical protein